MKLGLGTVQFGCDYGISNACGQVPFDEIQKILDYAKENGIDTIDTASLYGNSEEVLGQFDLEDFNVVTKTIKIDNRLDRVTNFEKFKEAFFSSQKKMGYVQFHGLMFHEASDLLSEQGYALWDLIEDFKQKEFVSKIGVSVYYPEQLIQIIDNFDIDIVQLPLNILDQRFLPLLPELKSKNIEIHTRSTFLQGLLLMEPNSLNPYFDDLKPLLKKLPENRLKCALKFVNSIQEVDKIIIGVTKVQELADLIKTMKEDFVPIDFNQYIINDERFILPQNWRLQ